jgi:hypothetical protein
MKIFLTILAYAGLAIVMLGTGLALIDVIYILSAPESAWSPGSWYFEWTGVGMLAGWGVAGFGALLALIGGLIARPRHLWISLIAIGLIYALSVGTYLFLPKGPREGVSQTDYLTGIALILVFTLPGIACIIEGLVIRMTKRKKAQVR